MTEQLHFHFSLSCIGEGNGNPLQCSCLENPRDGGAWWAAVYGVAQSRTRLKRLSSSSSSRHSLDSRDTVLWNLHSRGEADDEQIKYITQQIVINAIEKSDREKIYNELETSDGNLRWGGQRKSVGDGTGKKP